MLLLSYDIANNVVVVVRAGRGSQRYLYVLFPMGCMSCCDQPPDMEKAFLEVYRITRPGERRGRGGEGRERHKQGRSRGRRHCVSCSVSCFVCCHVALLSDLEVGVWLGRDDG